MRKLFESGDRGGAESLEVILLDVRGPTALVFCVVNVFIFETQLGSFNYIIRTIWITHKHHDHVSQIVHLICFSILGCLYEWVIVQYFAFKGHYSTAHAHASFPPPPHNFLLQPYSKIDYVMHMCSGALFNLVLSHPPWLRPFYQVCSDCFRTHGTVQTFSVYR